MANVLVVIWLLLLPVAICGSECVILLHGLGRTPFSMKPIETRLEKEGYTVHSIGYPSTRYSVEELCTLFVEKELKAIVSSGETVSFVTHSMGGILVRYMATRGVLSCGSVVMLCPPNQGSTLTDSLKKYIGWLFSKTNGPAGGQLGNDRASIIGKLAPMEQCPLGIIAGDRTFEPYFSRLIPGVDDGKVSIEETKLPEMDDFIFLHHSHTFMMVNDDVLDQIVYFLKHKKFIHN